MTIKHEKKTFQHCNLKPPKKSVYKPQSSLDRFIGAARSKRMTVIQPGNNKCMNWFLCMSLRKDMSDLGSYLSKKKGQRRVQKSLKFALCGKSRTYLDQRSEMSYSGVGVKL